MHAITFTEHGGPEVMQWAKVPDPTPGPGEVIIDVAASAVNAANAKMAMAVAAVVVAVAVASASAMASRPRWRLWAICRCRLMRRSPDEAMQALPLSQQDALAAAGLGPAAQSWTG